MSRYKIINPKNSALKQLKGFKTDGLKPFLTELNHFKLSDFKEIFPVFARDNLDKTNHQIIEGFLAKFKDIFYDVDDVRTTYDEDTGKAIKKYRSGFSFYAEFDKHHHNGKKMLNEEIDLLRTETTDFSWVAEKLKYDYQLQKKYKIFFFVNAFRQLFPNVALSTLGTSLTSIRCYIQNFWHKIDPTMCTDEQVCLYLYSSEGGTGKSFILKSLLDFVTSLGAPVADECDLRAKWVSDVYSKSLLCTVQELHPPKSNEDVVITNLNNIIDGGNYTSEKKFLDPKTLKARTTLAVASNHYPYQNNKRRYAIVTFNDYSIRDIVSSPDKFAEEAASLPVLSKEQRNELWRIMFTNCPFDTDFPNFAKGVADESIDKMLDRIQDLNNLPASKGFIDQCTKMTGNQFCTKLWEVEMANDNPIKKSNLKKDLTHLISYLVGKKLIKPLVRRGTAEFYNVFDFKAMLKLPSLVGGNSVSIPFELLQEPNFLKRNDDVVKYYIKSFCTPSDDEEDDESVSDSGVVRKLKVSKDIAVPDELVNKGLDRFGLLEKEEINSPSPTYERSTHHSFIQISPYADCFLLKHKMLTEFGLTPKIDATQEGKNPALILYESDSLPLEEQAKIIEECCEDYTDNLFSVTWSGNKSYHVLIPLITREEEELEYIKSHFTEIWKTVGMKIFKDYWKDFDINCAVWSKQSRKPNGTRRLPDGREVKQNCCWMNSDCESLDVAEIIKLTKERLEAKNRPEGGKPEEKHKEAVTDTVKDTSGASEPVKATADIDEEWDTAEDADGNTIWVNSKTDEVRTTPPLKKVENKNSTPKSTSTDTDTKTGAAFEVLSDFGLDVISKADIEAMADKLSKEETTFCLQMLKERDKTLSDPKKDADKKQKHANYYNFAISIILYHNPQSGSPMFGLLQFLKLYGASNNHTKFRGCIEKVQDICLELHPSNLRKPIVFSWQKVA